MTSFCELLVALISLTSLFKQIRFITIRKYAVMVSIANNPRHCPQTNHLLAFDHKTIAKLTAYF